ncbi:acyltransferase family protein [Paenibacillus glycanilyticus]|uniref:acyltransferase family protein n=1 Tax=Paenibacillus glycanilyticus TaxID=126569 RepID=UPI00203D43AE|nr:acyltransferase family protein [Paenibacillus glycanilyticus]MCM3630378.1 acyltransferase family protein [Paenibacillus glycanilyticus]
MIKNRETWMDTAKGIGILAVVMGHSDNLIAQHYLFWFHMPLFFAMSGYFYKPLENKKDFYPWCVKRGKQLLIPYFLFASVLTLFNLLLLSPDLSIKHILIEFAKIPYGGQALDGILSPFWFITCLFLTQILFALIDLKFKTNKTKAIIIGLLYLAAHLIAYLITYVKTEHSINLMVPWSADISLMTLTYYAIGFYLKSYFNAILKSKLVIGAIILLSLLFVGLDHFKVIAYDLDLKDQQYTNVLLDALIPFSLMIMVLLLSKVISASLPGRFFAHLGAASLPIMYLHIFFNTLMNQYISYNYLFFTLIGVAFPYAVTKLILEKFHMTNSLFLGNFKSKGKTPDNQIAA